MINENCTIVKEDYLVLIVDDQPEVLESARMLLELEGYTVICAQNGEEAIEAIKNKAVDLMLLDYFMPGMTGEDVVKKVREFNQDVIIVLQTGYAGEKPPLEMLRLLNIQGYHDKTEGPEKLLLWVASGLRACAQIRLNKHLKEGMSNILDSIPCIFKFRAQNELLSDILVFLKQLVNVENGFVVIENERVQEAQSVGSGKFKDLSYEEIIKNSEIVEKVNKAGEDAFIDKEEGLIILPIIYDSIRLGYMYLEDCNLEKEDADLVKIYLNQVTEAIINIKLHDEVVDSNQRLKDSYYNLKKNNYELIESFTKAVDAKDTYTAGHSTRVSIYARIIGRKLNMKNAELTKLKVAALFHDIGKIGIPDGVLLKEGRLTDEEFKVIKTHPEIGSRILNPVTMLADIIPAVKHHHEKYNGKGYPSGLAGEEIPLHARILAIADAFDAMTSDRSYQKKKTFEEALEELERCAGFHFDAELTDVFVGQFRKNMKFYTRLIAFWDRIHHFDKIKQYKDSYLLTEDTEELKKASETA
ncbi:MAG: HD domain-containing phosphohydrolase [Deltaproteobacteria bacterium]